MATSSKPAATRQLLAAPVEDPAASTSAGMVLDILDGGVGVAVTPLPLMVTEPVVVCIVGTIMVMVGVAHTGQVTTLVVNPGGIAGRIYAEGFPVHCSVMVYVAVQALD